MDDFIYEYHISITAISLLVIAYVIVMFFKNMVLQILLY